MKTDIVLFFKCLKKINGIFVRESFNVVSVSFIKCMFIVHLSKIFVHIPNLYVQNVCNQYYTVFVKPKHLNVIRLSKTRRNVAVNSSISCTYCREVAMKASPIYSLISKGTAQNVLPTIWPSI